MLIVTRATPRLGRRARLSRKRLLGLHSVVDTLIAANYLDAAGGRRAASLAARFRKPQMLTPVRLGGCSATPSRPTTVGATSYAISTRLLTLHRHFTGRR